MAKIAFILLCHRDPDAVIQHAQRLTSVGDYVAIHFDGRGKPEDFQKIKTALASDPSVTFARKRIACGWGEWSLVEATLQSLRAAVDDFPRASHFYMLSGDCQPIKSAQHAHRFLDNKDVDYIESFDFFASDWIKTGMKEERLIYRHFLNERTHKTLFYATLNMQKRLGLKRALPQDLQIQIGSQWWCLRRETIEAILSFVKKRRDVVRFFKRTWIPDETFFQTLVRHLIPRTEIESRSLTFLLFSDYGMPATFYNDHYDLLISQDYLFARKISPDAEELKSRLAALYASDQAAFDISNEGSVLFKFLTRKGRTGHRFAPRAWETESKIGRERELLIVVGKKWHVAKRFAQRVAEETNIPALHYLFDEEDTPLPDLGGIQSTLVKRHRHRRALLRMIYDDLNTKRLLICIDSSSHKLIEDFCKDNVTVRLLEVETVFTDSYLIGHARRVGLAGDLTPRDTFMRLLPSIRNDLASESDRLREMDASSFDRIRDNIQFEVNARAIASFLSTTEEKATRIAKTPNLFSD